MTLGQNKGYFLFSFGHLWNNYHLLGSAVDTANMLFSFKHRFYHAHFPCHKLTFRVGYIICIRSCGQTIMPPLVKYTPMCLEKK